MKKRIQFQFEDKIYIVDIERHGNEITIEREGEKYNITLLPEEKPKVVVNPAQPKHSTRSISSASSSLNTPPRSPGTTADGMLLAPMAGVISKLKTSCKQEVKKGQLVMIMEAMKMYIDIHAPKSGVIEDIFVHEGENVITNQKLLTIR